MRGLKYGDRVVFTRYASRQFPNATSQCGTVTNSADHPQAGRLLREGMVTVRRDGMKRQDYWHHSYWRKVQP